MTYLYDTATGELVGEFNSRKQARMFRRKYLGQVRISNKAPIVEPEPEIDENLFFDMDD